MKITVKFAFLFILLPLFAFNTLALAQIPNYVPQTGLVGWWPFNGNANDESGNGNHGTVNGASLTTDRNGNDSSAYNFNGNGNHIIVNHNPSFLNSNLSFSAWIKPTQFQTYFNSIIKHGDFNSNAGEQYGIGLNLTGQIHAGIKTSSCVAGQGWITNLTNNQVQLNVWNHLFVTIENNMLKAYLNSFLVDSFPYSGSLVICPAITQISFGREFNSSANHFYGSLDDIGIWNRALTVCEIQALYQGTVTITPQSLQLQSGSVALFSVNSQNQTDTYQWESDLGLGFQPINNGGQYSGAYTNQLTVSNLTQSNDGQLFRCIISNGICSIESQTATLTVMPDAGIIGHEAVSFKVMPNPTDGIITISFKDPITGQYQIKDNLGRVLTSGDMQGSEITLSVEHLPFGVYFVQVGNERVRFIKN